MKKSSIYQIVIISAFLFLTNSVMAQQILKDSTTENQSKMKTYLIEREIPDAGKLTTEDLKSISQKSCSVLEEMGPSIQWQQSFVSGNKIYCIYKAENEELIKEHAKKGGFPANSIVEVPAVISPATAKN